MLCEARAGALPPPCCGTHCQPSLPHAPKAKTDRRVPAGASCCRVWHRVSTGWAANALLLWWRQRAGRPAEVRQGQGYADNVGQAACGRCWWMLGFTHACSMRDGLTRAPARWPAERQGAVRAPVPAGARRRARVRARDAAPPAQAGHPEDRPGRAHARGAEPVRAPACCLAGKRAGTDRSLCVIRPALGLR